MADNEIQDYSYPNIEPIDYIDESLDKIKARDDSAKHGFRRIQTLPNVTADDVGMEVYLVGDGTYKLISYEADEPNWKKISDANRNPAYNDWVEANFQPISDILSSLARLTNTSNSIIYFTGPEVLQASPISQTGLALISGNNSAAMRTTLGLGNAATLTLPIDGSNIQDGTISMSKIDTNFANNMGFSTGDIKLTYKTAPDTGWIIVNDGSIGNNGSGATTRANADTEALFKLMWNIPACTVQTYTGAASSKTTAAQDWNANKRLVLPKLLGRALGIAGSGADLTTRNLGSIIGNESIQLTAANVPPHSHAGMQVYGYDFGYKGDTYGYAWGSPKGSPGTEAFNQPVWCNHGSSWVGRDKCDFSVITDRDGNPLTSSGSTTASSFDNLQPTSFVNLMIKL